MLCGKLVAQLVFTMLEYPNDLFFSKNFFLYT